MTNNTPKKKYKAGLISLSLWENEGENGKITSFTFQKSFKDKNTDEWKQTQSLNLNDLPKLILLLEEAYKDNVLKK